MPGRHSISPDNVNGIEYNLDSPLPHELLWTTTMSYCNVYRLTHRIFVECGVPIKNRVFSNDEISANFIPDKLYNSPNVIYNTGLEFLRFRDASQVIEDFVFEVKNFQKITNLDDVKTGMVLWETINSAMVKFMRDISYITNKLNNEMVIDSNINNTTMMKELYSNTFNQIVYAVTNNIKSYQNAFNFLKTYNMDFVRNNDIWVSEFLNYYDSYSIHSLINW